MPLTIIEKIAKICRCKPNLKDIIKVLEDNVKLCDNLVVLSAKAGSKKF